MGNYPFQVKEPDRPCFTVPVFGPVGAGLQNGQPRELLPFSVVFPVDIAEFEKAQIVLAPVEVIGHRGKAGKQHILP